MKQEKSASPSRLRQRDKKEKNIIQKKTSPVAVRGKKRKDEMNKTIFVPLAAALLLFIAAGCSGEKNDGADHSEQTDSTASQTVTQHIPHGETSGGEVSYAPDTETDVTTTPEITTQPPRTGKNESGTTPRVTTVEPHHTTTHANTSSVVRPGGYKTIYEQLSSQEKTAYDELLAGIKNHDSLIYLKARVDAESLYRVYEAILLTAAADEVYPPRQYKYSYSTVTGSVINVELAYDYTQTQIDRMNVKLEKRVNEILSGITSRMTTADKVRHLHDSVISGCAYSSFGAHSDNAYGALVDGKAVCEGYARSMLLLCRRAGISCILVTGFAEEEHMWNMVEIDGNWYHVDATWDDPSFADGREDYIGYTYLNVSDELIKRDHSIDSSLFKIPSANSSSANYFIRSGLYATSKEEALSVIERAIEKAAAAGQNCVSVRLSSKAVMRELNAEIFDSTWRGLFTIIDRVNEKLDTQIIRSSVEVYQDDKQYVIRIGFRTL